MVGTYLWAHVKKYPQLRVGESLVTWLLLGFSLFILALAYRISGFSSISPPGMFSMLAAAVMVLSIGLALIGNRQKRKPDAAGLLQELNQAYHGRVGRQDGRIPELIGASLNR